MFGVAPSAKAATGARTRDRDRLRHPRQAALRMATRRPPTARSLPATCRHDGDRRRGRHGRHRRSRSPGHASPNYTIGGSLLIGDHRQLQAVGRGGLFHELCVTGRSIELHPHPPIHPTVGSSRVLATATRRPARPQRLLRPRSGDRRHLRQPPRPHRRPVARHRRQTRHRGDHRGDQRTRRRDQRRRPNRTDRYRPTRPNPRDVDRWRRARRTSAMSWRLGATTATCTPRPVNRSATVSCGPSPAYMTTAG